ncbi:hypothetical protein [Hyphococcus sp.]|uniref:hypothetical protein n=1 Tax=Hyphococcus sp. TaxID=2038636 RepID=UPI003CCB84CD
MRWFTSVSLFLTVLLIATAQQPAWACRCWVGNSETTDEERLDRARIALNRAHFAVIGQIFPIHSLTQYSDDDLIYSPRRGAAKIIVEKVIVGNPPAEIIIPERPQSGDRDGEGQSWNLGTCGENWEDGERNLWLVLKNASGEFFLESSCAHTLVRRWLYSDFYVEVDQ